MTAIPGSQRMWEDTLLRSIAGFIQIDEGRISFSAAMR